ncbi:MAG TPA: radical SAM protein [Dehalococcoidia bacterium]|nr:radical SAM protein [Dehalococcoidia bacterium]
MRVTLVQPPNGLHDRQELAPPLGLLTIAAALEEDGVDVALVDMNLRGMRNPAWLADGFYERAVRAIRDTRPDLVGFTSMALESHVGLELARRLKAEDPGVVTLLGGPHFGAIAREALEHYPWVDYVVAGEGEEATAALVRRLRGLSAAPLINVAQRTAGGVTLQRAFKTRESLASLPAPAYHLVDLNAYFTANPQRLLDYEHGRGCIFRCSFCYSPTLWGQGEQAKTIDRIVGELAQQHALGARHLFFVQDNFLNAPQSAKGLLHAIAEARLGLTWNGYGTLPQLTPEILDLLAKSGCQDIFVGVDAVSATAQQAFAKHFFKGWQQLEARLAPALERGVGVTCAFMLDVPGNSSAEAEATLTTALFARALGCGVRLNTLTIYNGTGTDLALADRPRAYNELKPRIMLDAPPLLYDNPFARERPELFPFHNTFHAPETYHGFITRAHLAYALFLRFPQTLVQYVLVDGGTLWGLIDHLASQIGDLTKIDPLYRYQVEWETFMRELPRLSPSCETRSALALERAQLGLSFGASLPPLPVRAEGRIWSLPAAPFTVVNLAYAPETIHGPRRLSEPDAAEQPYLLVREERRIAARPISAEQAASLRGVNAARRGGVPLEATPELLATLAQSGVVPIVPAGAGDPLALVATSGSTPAAVGMGNPVSPIGPSDPVAR